MLQGIQKDTRGRGLGDADEAPGLEVSSSGEEKGLPPRGDGVFLN